MTRIIGIAANGPELDDNISEHFGHCNYFIGVKTDTDNSLNIAFSIKNEGHSGCMEPVISMKDRNVTDMILGGIGGRPFMGFLQVGISLYQGIPGKTIKENVSLLLEERLDKLEGPNCGHH